MKHPAIILFILVSNFLFSQQTSIKAVVKDAVTKEAVMSASVGVKNSPAGTITNDEGIFQLTVSKTATVVISCLGYKTFIIPVIDFKQETTVIFLEQSQETLEEVTVTKIPLWQILEDIITTSKARFNKPIVLNTYYREFSKTNGKYDKFSDGLLDYHITGNTKKTKSDLVVKQNRTVALKTKEEAEEEGDAGSVLSVQRGISNSYSFENVSRYLLDDNRYEDYDWQLKIKKDKDGNDYYCIYFDPKPEIEKSLFKGTITYDAKSKLIYDIDMVMAPSHQKYAKDRNFLIAHIAVLDIKFRASYKMVGSNYMLSFNNRSARIKLSAKKYSETIESRSDLIVTNFEKDQAYSSKEVFTKQHLYQKPSHYTDKFWQRNNAIVLTDEEEKIINALENAAPVTPK